MRSMLRALLTLAQPVNGLFAVLGYALGLGVARYLGVTRDAFAAMLGGLVVLSLSFAAAWLTERFRPFDEPLREDETRAARETLRRHLLTAALITLGISGLLIFLLVWLGALNTAALAFLLLIVAVAVIIGLPPIRLQALGLGELGWALLVATLPPAFAYALQAGDVHRIVFVLSFPLTLLALAAQLASDFPHFAEHLKFQRATMLMRLGWERAITVHNLLLAGAYLALVSALAFGIPSNILWPGLLSLPLAAYQVFMLHRISEGAAPVWRALVINAAAIFGVTAYLLTLTFWMR